MKDDEKLSDLERTAQQSIVDFLDSYLNNELTEYLLSEDESLLPTLNLQYSKQRALLDKDPKLLKTGLHSVENLISKNFKEK